MNLAEDLVLFNRLIAQREGISDWRDIPLAPENFRGNLLFSLFFGHY